MVTASGDADYGWLPAAVTRLRQIVTTYDLGWETELRPPATWEAIDAAERAIGIPLPPSLHAFYEVHDGADLFDMHVLALDALVADTLRMRERAAATYGQSVDDLLAVVRIDYTDGFVLDSSGRDDRGEYPLLDAFHEYPPSDWRGHPVARSFGAWLRDTFDRVVERELGPWPNSTETLDFASPSAARQHALAVEARAAGRIDEARRRFVRAFALRRYDDDSGAECDAAELNELVLADPGEQFVTQFLVRIADARRRARERGGELQMHVSPADELPYDFAAERKLSLPWDYAALVADFSSVSLFSRGMRQRSLTFFGRTRVERACDEFFALRDVPDGAMVIAEVTGWGPDDRTSVLIQPAGDVWLAPTFDGFLGVPGTQPRRVAPSLSVWLAKLFDRFAETGKPFGDELADETPPEIDPERHLRGM